MFKMKNVNNQIKLNHTKLILSYQVLQFFTILAFQLADLSKHSETQ
jgi:hypothetical protein